MIQSQLFKKVQAFLYFRPFGVISITTFLSKHFEQAFLILLQRVDQVTITNLMHYSPNSVDVTTLALPLFSFNYFRRNMGVFSYVLTFISC